MKPSKITRHANSKENDSEKYYNVNKKINNKIKLGYYCS